VSRSETDAVAGTLVAVSVGVFVAVAGTLVAVSVGVFVAVAGTLVAVSVGVLVAVAGTLVAVSVGVLVAVAGTLVAVSVGVLVAVLVGVFVAVFVGVFVDVLVAVFVAVGVASEHVAPVLSTVASEYVFVCTVVKSLASTVYVPVLESPPSGGPKVTRWMFEQPVPTTFSTTAASVPPVLYVVPSDVHPVFMKLPAVCGYGAGGGTVELSAAGQIPPVNC
jgi:hypothetical protein